MGLLWGHAVRWMDSKKRREVLPIRQAPNVLPHDDEGVRLLLFDLKNGGDMDESKLDRQEKTPCAVFLTNQTIWIFVLGLPSFMSIRSGRPLYLKISFV